MTKKEYNKFIGDVRFLVDSTLIATYGRDLEAAIANVEKTNFSESVKNEAIKRIKEVRTK